MLPEHSAQRARQRHRTAARSGLRVLGLAPHPYSMRAAPGHRPAARRDSGHPCRHFGRGRFRRSLGYSSPKSTAHQRRPRVSPCRGPSAGDGTQRAPSRRLLTSISRRRTSSKDWGSTSDSSSSSRGCFAGAAALGLQAVDAVLADTGTRWTRTASSSPGRSRTPGRGVAAEARPFRRARIRVAVGEPLPEPGHAVWPVPGPVPPFF